MLYIKEINKVNDIIKNVRVIYSIERKDIEFEWGISAIISGLKKGHKFRTVYYNTSGVLVEGADVELIEDGNTKYIRTHKNDTSNDNLNKLPTF